VIDGEGNIVYAGDSPESALAKAMKVAKAGPMWPKKLAKAATFLRANKLGEAWSEIEALKAAGKLDERETQVLERFSKYIADASTGAVKAASELLKADLVYQAVQKLEGIAQVNPELPATKDANTLLAEMQALPRFDDEIKGGSTYATGLVKEDDCDYVGAVTTYRDLAKKFDGTKIAGVAMKRAQELVQQGMPGYAQACEKCMKAKKACEKHPKTIDL
jgi:hypothetical protein